MKTINNPKKDNFLLFSITILSDCTSWMAPWIEQFLEDLSKEGHKINWVHEPPEVSQGDFCFILSFSRVIEPNILSRNKHNLVIHASDLPKGKGMSPMSWQILEGKNKIRVTLFEAVKSLDAGNIYLQESIEFEGHELLDELRTILANSIIKLCSQFIINYPSVLSGARKQAGDGSFYPKRTIEDSILDIDKSLREQFQLLRIVDNERYPAFFELNGHRYILKIDKH
jgi:methionyl-tRNA formyltransferase